MNNPEYFTAYIGPIDRDELDKRFPIGEGHLRGQLQEAFFNVAGHHADVCGSGWGTTKDRLDHMSFADNNEKLKRALVQSYISENKTMPRYVQAWYLLLKSEGNI